MNKIIILVVVVVLVGVGAYVFFGRSEPAPVNLNTNTTTNTNTDTNANKTIDENKGSQKIFDISSKKFEFSVKEMRVKKGDTVTVNLSSSDGLHDWVVDELNARTTQINTGEKTSVTFVANTVGTFEFYCSVGSHRQMGMKGTIIVE
jgi:plastocyanin